MDLNALSEAAAPPATKAEPANGKKKAEKPEAEAKPYEPMVHGESAYDRVSSLLLSLVIGASLIVGFLWLVNYTNQAYAAKTPPPVELIEVYGDGNGGGPDGEAGGTGVSEEIAGTEKGAPSDGTSEDAGQFEEPAVQQASSTVLDPFTSADNADAETGEVSSSDQPSNSNSSTGSSVKRSFKGNGLKGFGTGKNNGPGGMSRELRWVFEVPPGQGVQEYARMLDYFGIELGTRAGSNQITYGSNFSSGSPQRRTGLSRQEERMYLSWAGQSRRKYDIELLTSAGIKVDANSFIIQFMPKKIEDKIAQTEYNFKGRQPGEIKKTKFKIVSSGNTFDFQVISQETWK